MESTVNQSEKNLASILLEIIKSASETPSFYLTSDTTLEFKQSYEIDNTESDPMAMESLSEQMDLDEPSTSGQSFYQDYQRRAVAYWFNNRPGWRYASMRRSFQSVQSKFPQLENIEQLEAWASKFNETGAVDRAVYDKFEEETSVNTIVHDRDLQFWAKKISREVGLQNFRPSNNWLVNFKLENEIVTRKVYKFVVRQLGRKFPSDGLETAIAFRVWLRGFLATAELSDVFNVTDYKLNDKCSVVLIINAEGRLLSPLTIVIKDATKAAADLAAEVQAKIPFLYVITGRFNTLTTKPFAKWFSEVLAPQASERFCLVLNNRLNSASDQLATRVTENQLVDICIIPQDLESTLDPLNYGFKLWNLFVKNINDYADLHQEHQFDRQILRNVIKVQAFVHHQLSAERYGNLFKDCWRSCGFLDVDNLGIEGLDPVTFAFGSETSQDSCQSCGNEAFFRCARCETLMCFEHVLMVDNPQGFHFHEN